MAFSGGGGGSQELDCNKEWGGARNIGVRGILEKVVMGMCDGVKITIEFVSFCCEGDEHSHL